MFKIGKKVSDRIRSQSKRFQKIVVELRQRDVAEPDTVTAVKDILEVVFGYDKYLELTGEYQIRGTYCDLAVKIDNKVRYLIEVKSAGTDLNESHVRQAVDYAAKEGIEWVVLTNALEWRLFRLKFAQPIEQEEVVILDFANMDLKNEGDLNKAFVFAKEAIGEKAMDAYHRHSQLLNRYTIADLVRTEPVVSVIRREFRKLFPDVKVDKEDIAEILETEVLKREVVESDKAHESTRRIAKVERKLAKQASKKKEATVEKREPEAATPNAGSDQISD